MNNYWEGRIDGTNKNQLRWHQIVKSAEEVASFKGEFVILGYECEEGVIRNLGRPGAMEGPKFLRNSMSNLPAYDIPQLYDAGNVKCESHDLEKAQRELEDKLITIYKKNGKSFVLGGGHSVVFPHYQALKKTFKDKKIGIINFDAHFDNRKLNPEIGATSGTGFYQIAEEGPIHSLHIGIQPNSNTPELFEYASKHKMLWIENSEFTVQNDLLLSKIDTFIKEIDILYVTVCLDVFSASIAPGVSATAYSGMINDPFFYSIFRYIIGNEKLYAFDIAELNPTFDIDYRTSKLGASLAFELMTIGTVKP